MSSTNALPSAPPESSPEPLNPILTTPAENFRLQKIDEIAKVLDQEVGHHRLVVKKYKRAKKIRYLECCGLQFSLSSVFKRELWFDSVGGWPAGHNSLRRRWRLFRSRFFGANNRQQEI